MTGRRSRRSWSSSSTQAPAIAEAAKIVPLTEEQVRPPRTSRQGRERYVADSVADYSAAASEGAMGRRTSLVRRPSRRSRFEAAIRAHPLRRGGRLDRDDARDRLLVAQGDDRVLRRRPDRRLPVRDEVDAAVRRRPAVLRRDPAGLGHALPHRHRPRRRDPRRDPVGHVPLRVRAAPRAQGRQAGARGARRRADDRLRLLRPDVLHAGGAPQRARARREPVQRAFGRDHPRHPRRADDRDPRRGCDVGGAAVAPRGSAGLGANRVRRRSGSCSRRRFRAWSPRSCSALRARSARP